MDFVWLTALMAFLIVMAIISGALFFYVRISGDYSSHGISADTSDHISNGTLPIYGFVIMGISVGAFFIFRILFKQMGLFEWEERLSRARITRVEQRANMRQQQAIMRQRQTKQMKAKEAERLRIEKAREFALRETPVIWETYQRLGSELDIQSTKVEQLRNVIVELGKAPEYDDDYVKLTNQLREMNEVRKKLIGKIEDACIAKAKAEATPGRGDSAALWEKAQEDGIRAAVAAERRFIELKETK